MLLNNKKKGNASNIKTDMIHKSRDKKFSPNNIDNATQELFGQKHLSVNSEEKKKTSARCTETVALHSHIFMHNKTFLIYNVHLMLNILES